MRIFFSNSLFILFLKPMNKCLPIRKISFYFAKILTNSYFTAYNFFPIEREYMQVKKNNRMN